MSRYRTLSNKNKYYIPKEDYLTAIHYSRRHPLLLQELSVAADTSKAIRYDKDKVQSCNDMDATSETAIRMTEITEKINPIDNTIHQAANGMDEWLRYGVCYGLTFNQLKSKGMPCERDMYYLMRRHYYFLLSKRI